jgi:hypothetical protein
MRETWAEPREGVPVETDERVEDPGWSEEAPNPTQERIGEGEEKPVDASWEEDDWGDMPEESPLA